MWWSRAATTSTYSWMRSRLGAVWMGWAPPCSELSQVAHIGRKPCPKISFRSPHAKCPYGYERARANPRLRPSYGVVARWRCGEDGKFHGIERPSTSLSVLSICVAIGIRNMRVPSYMFWIASVALYRDTISKIQVSTDRARRTLGVWFSGNNLLCLISLPTVSLYLTYS